MLVGVMWMNKLYIYIAPQKVYFISPMFPVKLW